MANRPYKTLCWSDQLKALTLMSNTHQRCYGQDSYSFALFMPNSMTFHHFFHDLFKFSKTLGLAVSFKHFKNFPCFRVFYDVKQFNRHKLWCLPKSMPFAMFNCLVICSNSFIKQNFNFTWLSRTNNILLNSMTFQAWKLKFFLNSMTF